MNAIPWYLLESPQEVLSPALLFYPDRIRENIREMIKIAGSAERLWPHVKTHKNADIIRLQQEVGIDKFKCSTLAEAALLGKCGVKEAVLAMQPTEVHLDHFLKLTQVYPDTGFSTLVDNELTLSMICDKARSTGHKIRLWLDVNNGMNRTGILPGSRAAELFEQISKDPGTDCMGLHIYDGHIHDADPLVREESCRRAMEPVRVMIDEIASRGLRIDKIIAGGSPTFPVHAKSKDLDLSPGTTLLWDAGYGNKYADMQFKPAAALLTRVISKPAPHMLCTDLGHKSVASEMSFPRVELLTDDQCEQVSQSEEHLVLKSKDPDRYPIGKPMYALPIHICPTVSKYARAHVVEKNRITGSWSISARDHDLELKI